MVHRQAFAVAAIVLGFARDPGCGGVDDPHGGKNAPCTRNSDCAADLVCSEGVCTDPNVARDASVPVTDGGATAKDSSSDDGG